MKKTKVSKIKKLKAGLSALKYVSNQLQEENMGLYREIDEMNLKKKKIQKLFRYLVLTFLIQSEMNYLASKNTDIGIAVRLENINYLKNLAQLIPNDSLKSKAKVRAYRRKLAEETDN